MIKSLYVLSMVLLVAACSEFYEEHLDALLLLSISLGIYSLTQLQVDWHQKVTLKVLTTQRYGISWEGKIASVASSALLVVYFCALFSGAHF
jgi:hypothetical protein